MKSEEVWHCPVCHYMDCLGIKKRRKSTKHIPYRGVDIGSCKGTMEKFVKINEHNTLEVVT